MNKHASRAAFLLLGFVLCLFVSGLWSGVFGQIGGMLPPGQYPVQAPQDGQAQVDQAAIVGGARTVGVTRPLEVPPIYAFESPIDATRRQLIVVDSETKRICVYHVRPDGNKSTIEMVASRNFQWDLKLDDFNNTGLSPAQIREQLDRKKTGRTQ